MKVAPIVQSKKIFVVLLLLLVLLIGSVATSQAAPPRSYGHYHLVRYGETLSGIAHHYGLSVHAILQANPQIYNPHLIFAGMSLFIPKAYAPPVYPPGAPTSYCRFNHYISYGQNLSSIAAYYGVHPYAIAQANHIYNLNRIYAGQYLCIP
jgi:N-acetylmuramoyl-L-alanine amidase